MRYRILNLFGEHLTPETARILGSLGHITSRVMTYAELREAIGGYDVLFMGLYPEIDRAVLEQAKDLKVVATASTNLYHIDTDYAGENNIAVLSLQNETDFLDSITGTAEMAVGLMIDLLRKTPWAFDDVKSYHWRREKFRGFNLYGKTLGIVGLGRLGRWMARYGNAFNMKVIAYSPHSNRERFENAQCRSVDFDALLRESDIISINAHLTKETTAMFNAQAFEKMKKSAYIVNTAAGGIVDEAALLRALKRGDIAGYGTDVLTDEMHFDERFRDHPLVEYAKTHDNMLIVPHLGGMTYESRAATDIFMANKVKDFLHTLT